MTRRTAAARTHELTVTVDGETLAARVHQPARHSEPGATDRTPVVVLGSWTTVKEQMAGSYAASLAAAGYTAWTFDPAGWGDSTGQPRHAELPDRKVADLTAVARHVASASPTRSVALVGICAGGAYAARVAAFERDIVSSLALIAPWLHDADLVAQVYGGTAAVSERMAAGSAAQRRYEDTEHVDYVPAVSETDPAAAMYGPFDYYLDAGRGAVPQWPNRLATLSWGPWLTLDAHPAADAITAPTLIVHSENAAIPEGARRFHDRLNGVKRLVWQPGDQFAFYDDATTVARTVDLIADHLAACGAGDNCADTALASALR